MIAALIWLHYITSRPTWVTYCNHSVQVRYASVQSAEADEIWSVTGCHLMSVEHVQHWHTRGRFNMHTSSIDRFS